MSKKHWRIAGVLAMVIVIAVVVLDPFPGNRVYSNVYGDAGPVEIIGISAGRRSPARFQGDGKAATVQLGEQSARVTADRVELPGGRVVAVPAGCKSVELRETRDGLGRSSLAASVRSTNSPTRPARCTDLACRSMPQ